MLIFLLELAVNLGLKRFVFSEKKWPVALVCFLLSGCYCQRGSENGAKSHQESGVRADLKSLTIAGDLGGSPSAFEDLPASLQRFLAVHIWEGLVRIGPDEKPIEGIASHWIWQTPRQLRFTLRPQAGDNRRNELNSRDVLESWINRLKRSDIFGEILAEVFLFDVSGHKNVESELRRLIGAVSDDQLVIEFPAVPENPEQLVSRLGQWPFSPIAKDGRIHEISIDPQESTQNGPWLIASRQPLSLELKKNPSYWAAEEIDVESITLADNSIFQDGLDKAFVQQKVAILEVVTDQSLQSLTDMKAGLHPREGAELIFMMLGKSPARNRLLQFRQAVRIGINRESLVKATKIDGRPLYGFVPEFAAGAAGSYGQGHGRRFRDGNVSAARRLLEEVHGQMKGGETIEIAHAERDALANHICETVQRNFGWQCREKSVSQKELLNTVRSGEFDLALYAVQFGPSAPVDFVRFWAAKNTEELLGNQSAAYGDLIKKALSAQDRGSALAFVQDAERLLVEESRIVPLVERQSLFAIHPSISGVQMLSSGSVPYFLHAKFVRGE